MKKFCGDFDRESEKRNVYTFRYNVPLFYTYQWTIEKLYNFNLSKTSIDYN